MSQGLFSVGIEPFSAPRLAPHHTTAYSLSMSELQNTPEAFAAQLREGHYNELRDFLAAGTFRSVHTGGPDSNSRSLLVPRAEVLRIPGALTITLPSGEDFFGQLFRAHER